MTMTHSLSRVMLMLHPYVLRRPLVGKCKHYHNIPANSLPQAQPFSLILPRTTNSPCQPTAVEPVSNLPASYEILESGMILMKNHICLMDQVEIVNICHQLGVGPGGFQKPGYSSGSKLWLQRMCFGRNWDLETKYKDQYNRDGSIPPPVPQVLASLVQILIQDAQERLYSRDEIPLMFPDVCLVNFYTSTGKLGLHQDCSESPSSLRRGLPVVSISIGDSGEFLYGWTRDEKDLRKLVLESGDVLIFGGKSRLVYHGVTTIFPNSAPPALLQKSMLRPGRLNLTFRQF